LSGHESSISAVPWAPPLTVARSLIAHPIAASITMFGMSKSQDAKKNVKKAPTRTPKEKKELKRLKKAGK
jgi:hypothetical protein